MLNRTKKITRKVHEKTESRDQNNFDEHFYKIGLQEDALEALDFINGFGIKQAIVSNNSRTAMGDKVLSLTGMREHISTSFFLEDMGGRKKPDPEIMSDVIAKADIEDHETIWVIGDSASDMKFAIAANEKLENTVVPIAMGHSSRAASFLESDQYDGTFAVLSDMLDVAVITATLQEVLDVNNVPFLDM